VDFLLLRCGHADGRALAAMQVILQGQAMEVRPFWLSDWRRGLCWRPFIQEQAVAANPNQSITVRPVLMEHPQGRAACTLQHR
jgi:hypothetical protein